MDKSNNIKRKRGRPPKVKPELKLEVTQNNYNFHPFPKSAQLHYKTKE